MKGARIKYSAEELAWVEANCTTTITELHQQFVDRFARSDVSAGNLHALRKRNGWKTGRTGQFSKGQTAHNKGKPCAPGTGGRHPNAVRTQFKKGVRQGVAERLYEPIGTEKIRDGYLARKVNDDKPLQARWKFVHTLRWEAQNGPVPEGHCLKCLDGDRMNTDPSNWECIPRTMLGRLNGGRFRRSYDQYPAELKPTIMAVAKLKQRASDAQKKARE